MIIILQSDSLNESIVEVESIIGLYHHYGQNLKDSTLWSNRAQLLLWYVKHMKDSIINPSSSLSVSTTVLSEV